MTKTRSKKPERPQDKPITQDKPKWLFDVPTAISLMNGVPKGECRRFPTEAEIQQGALQNTWLYPEDELWFVCRCHGEGLNIAAFDNYIDEQRLDTSIEAQQAVRQFTYWRKRALDALNSDNLEAFVGWATAIHMMIDYAALWGRTAPVVDSYARVTTGHENRAATKRRIAFQEWLQDKGRVQKIIELRHIPIEEMPPDVRAFIYGDPSISVAPTSLETLKEAYKEVWPGPLSPGRPKKS